MQIYVIRDEQRARCKVGITADVPQRLAALRREHGSHLWVAKAIEIEGVGLWHERTAHGALSDCAMGGEWFSCSIERAVGAIDGVKTAPVCDELLTLLGVPVRMLELEKCLRLVDLWLKATGMTPSRLGLLACANARAVERVRNGTGSVESLRQLIDYIDAHPLKRLKS